MVQRKFDFTRLAESALLDDFEVVTRRTPVSASATLTSSSHHLAAAAAAAADNDDDKRSYRATPTPRRNVNYIEAISKHVYVYTI